MSLIQRIWKYLLAVIRWFPAAFLIGIAGGLVGTAFYFAVDYVTELRLAHPWILYLLPVGAVLCVLIYQAFRLPETVGTNRVIDAVRTDQGVPLRLLPVIFISTVMTHLFGGSAGREGAALQLGGSLGFQLSRLFRFGEKDSHLLTLCGMAAVFSALFGTPITAVFFVLEVIAVGEIYYAGLVPCLLSSLTAYALARFAGGESVRFVLSVPAALTLGNVLRTAALGVGCAVLSIAFCVAVHRGESLAQRLLPHTLLRAVVIGAILLGMSLLVGTQTYNGAGMDVVFTALAGEHIPWYSFAVKLIFTAVTLAAGFRGGEIVPTFFVGATFGAVAGPLLGLDPGFAAALAMVALFCGVVNCPVASMFLAIEVFGGGQLVLFAVAVAVSYVLSGYYGLYSSQRIVYSKLRMEFINRNTK